MLLQVTFNLSYGMYIYGIYSYDNFKGCHTPHCFGDKQYTSNRDPYYHQIRRETDRFGRLYVCGTPPPPKLPPPPPPPICMTPGHRVGGGSRAVCLDICSSPPHQAYQYTSRQVLKSTTDWWGI